jgi:hypothetical protein
MSSSIFISKRMNWRRALGLYAVACPLIVLVAAILLIGFDPYDTGRLGFAEGYGVPDSLGPRLTAASTARAPDAEAAIIGNSTIELLDPARLSDMTATRFVSLAIAGTGPTEQLAVADWFAAHHPAGSEGAAKAIVFGLDRTWCEGDGRLDLANPFPFWLYSPSVVDYALGMLQLKTFESLSRKIDLMLGRRPALPANGYRDYETANIWTEGAAERAAARGDASILASDPPDFAAVPLLQQFLARLPTQTRVILVLPPRYIRSLPPEGSAEARVEAQCKAAYRAVANERPSTMLVDFAIDGEIARDGRNFWDLIHYRGSVARQIEAAVAVALRAEAAN